MNTNSLLRGPPTRTARGMAMRQQIQDAVLKEIIHDEIIIEQRHELAALATLMLARAKEEDASSNSYETSYEYYEEDEEEDPSSVEQPQPTSMKRSLPRNETQNTLPQKRQRIDPTPAARPQLQPQQEIKNPETPPEAKDWMPAPLTNFPTDNSHRHPVLQAVLRKSPIEYARPVAQTFLQEMDCDKLGAPDVAKAVFDMGIRYSRMASDNEFKIAFFMILANIRDAVRYNTGTPSEKHLVFWGIIQRLTHRDIPPDPFKAPAKEPERKAEVKPEPRVAIRRTVPAPAPAREKAEPRRAPVPAPAPVREKPRGNLKASLIKEVDEKTKIPLNERVRKWLDDVVSMSSTE
ncbi:hypothetical protein N0V84_010712 [Fusarium piperis]|uniref:Uncharacterized protein n=1 Tax=Fusarium piperis TaxID=1435070 RepID=A0A9W8TBS4_9HYPO|nr:hypothetical protein N0V84_010712 [Fusarium piperis]